MKLGIVAAAAALAFVVGCGKDKESNQGDAPPGSGDALPLTTWDAEIHPLLQKSCGGCHTAGAKHAAFVDDEALFKSMAVPIAERIKSEEPKVVMPPPRSRDGLTSGERQALLAYLGQ